MPAKKKKKAKPAASSSPSSSHEAGSPRGPTPPAYSDISDEGENGIKPETQVHQSPGEKEGEGEDVSSQKAKRKPNLQMDEAMEEEVIGLLIDNPVLYAKGLRDYKDTVKKQRLWEKKAEELNLETSILQTWYKSMRTRLSKLTKSKSGDGSREMTDRDKWILNSFEFLKKHICRLRSRPGINVSICFYLNLSELAGPAELFEDINLLLFSVEIFRWKE